jgi:hypothetical protein
MPYVDAIEALVRRFPDHAPKIRRLQTKDATLRAICEDYAEALRALEYWQAADRSSKRKAEEYHWLVQELADEALAVLKVAESETPPRKPPGDGA